MPSLALNPLRDWQSCTGMSPETPLVGLAPTDQSVREEEGQASSAKPDNSPRTFELPVVSVPTTLGPLLWPDVSLSILLPLLLGKEAVGIDPKGTPQ